MARIMHRNDIYEQELLRLSSVMMVQGDFANSLHAMNSICSMGRCNNSHYTTIGVLENQMGNFTGGIYYCNKVSC